MQTTDLIKENGVWMIQLPEYTENEGSKKDLQLEDDVREILETLAEGKSEISVKACVNPFEGCDYLLLDELATPSVGGAYYTIKTLQGKPMNKRIWLKDLLLFQFEDIPETIYFKKIEQ